jgi:hypothetical protein
MTERVDPVTMVCHPHDVHGCQECMVDDFHNRERWTYSGIPTANPDVVRRRYPDAIEKFDLQAADLHPRARMIIDVDHFAAHRDRLRVSIPSGNNSRGSCLTWVPEVKTWRWWSTSVRSRRRQGDPPLRDDSDVVVVDARHRDANPTHSALNKHVV